MRENIFYLAYLNRYFINSCIKLDDITAMIVKIKNSGKYLTKSLFT